MYQARATLQNEGSVIGVAAKGANGALLSAQDVAEIVGMTKDWVYAETRAGRIPHVQLGRYYRYRAESIEAWLRGIEQRATQPLRR